MKTKWEIKKLGEVCEVLDSKRKPITKRNRIAGGYPYYGATGILDYVHDYIFDEQLILIGEDGARWGEGENTAFIAEGKYWVNNHAHVIRPDRSAILDKWLIYFLNFSDLRKYVTGLTVPKLNQEKMRGITFPLPSLSEQKRILNILDVVFKKTTKAKENAEKNLQNAHELFESYSCGAFKNPGDWDERTLGEMCNLYQGLAINAKTKHALVPKSDLPLLRIKDLISNKVEQYVDPNNYPKNALINKSDLLYTRTGQIGLVFMGKKGVLHNNSFKIEPNEKLRKDYLFYWLQNPVFKSKIITLALRAAQPDITHKLFKQQIIAVPPMDKQKSIVSSLRELSAQINKLKDTYKQKLDNLDKIKRSILQKVFNGEFAGAQS